MQSIVLFNAQLHNKLMAYYILQHFCNSTKDFLSKANLNHTIKTFYDKANKIMH